MMNILKNIAKFYINGFKNLEKLGIRLWVLILIKLFIIFVILKIFFFPNFLDNKFDNDKDKSKYIFEQIT